MQVRISDHRALGCIQIREIRHVISDAPESDYRSRALTWTFNLHETRNAKHERHPSTLLADWRTVQLAHLLAISLNRS